MTENYETLASHYTEMNRKHKENECLFLSYVYLYAKKTQMWLGNMSP